MKIYKLSQKIRDYLSIGHEPSLDNPVYLWIMRRDGTIEKYKTNDPNDPKFGHRIFNNFHDSLCGGRYEIKTKICSIYYDRYKYDWTYSLLQWIKSLVLQEFGTISELFEANKPLYSKSKANLKIYKLSQYKFSKPSKDWFGEGAIFGYTRIDNFKSMSVRLKPETAATWNQKNGITHEEVFGLMQLEIPAWTWIYDIGRHKLDGWGDIPQKIKETAMEEVMKKL